MPIKCPIWQTPASGLPHPANSADTIFINSPRAGGNYSLTGTAVALLPQLTEIQKAKITTWIVDQHLFGVDMPTLDEYSMKPISQAPALSIEVRRDRLLRYVAHKCPRLGDQITLAGPNPLANFSREMFNFETMAWTESLTGNEASALVQYARIAGYLDEQELAPWVSKIEAYLADQPNVRLTFKGHLHLEQMSKVVRNSAQAFVAMWFSDETKKAFEVGVEPAVRDMGYRPLRIDRKEHSNKIDDEIIAEIRRSRFIIADFTCGIVNDGKTVITIPRGGVYYEAGFAQGLGIPVIWTCHEDQIGQVHFDTRQFNHVTWKDPHELYDKLRNRIGAVIGDGPNKPN